MAEAFHPGELEMQRRAGLGGQARGLERIIGRRLPEGAGRFLARQRFAVAASLEPSGRVWASLVTGAAGFIQVLDPQLLRLAATPAAADPLVADLAARPELGLLVLDPRTRQRMRFNGRGLLRHDGLFLLVEQAYGNCPKYIQRRRLEPDGVGRRAGRTRVSSSLDARQRAAIAGADTLFIASVHPRAGADASHRGGFPGFVAVLGPDRLVFPDYPGNGMFNTLGNLLAHPQAGLLFLDFASGDVLQLTGRAEVLADFAVSFQVDEVRETPGMSALRFGSSVEYSPANPSLSHGAPGGISSSEPGDPGPEGRA